MAENETQQPSRDEERDVRVNIENIESEEKIETPMERFFYHQRRALEETSKALDALLPPDFKRHSSEASREFTKGFRVLVDATIDELKKVSEREVEAEDANTGKGEDDNEPPSSTGGNKVKIKLD